MAELIITLRECSLDCPSSILILWFESEIKDGRHCEVQCLTLIAIWRFKFKWCE